MARPEAAEKDGLSRRVTRQGKPCPTGNEDSSCRGTNPTAVTERTQSHSFPLSATVGPTRSVEDGIPSRSVGRSSSVTERTQFVLRDGTNPIRARDGTNPTAVTKRTQSCSATERTQSGLQAIAANGTNPIRAGCHGFRLRNPCDGRGLRHELSTISGTRGRAVTERTQLGSATERTQLSITAPPASGTNPISDPGDRPWLTADIGPGSPGGPTEGPRHGQ
jgi:hypothetical protein